MDDENIVESVGTATVEKPAAKAGTPAKSEKVVGAETDNYSRTLQQG
jgi:hypothetical protein